MGGYEGTTKLADNHDGQAIERRKDRWGGHRRESDMSIEWKIRSLFYGSIIG